MRIVRFVSAGIKEQRCRRFCSSKEQTHWRGRGTHSTQDSKCRLATATMTALPSDLRQLVEFSRTGYRTCAVFLMQDRDTQRVYRLCDINKSQLIPPDQAYCDAGNVNSADELYLVIESVRPDTKHHRDSSAPTHADGAGGSLRG